MAGAPTPPPHGGPPAKGGKLGDWVKKHKAVVIGGGIVGAVGVLYLLQQSGSGSGSSASPGTTSTTADGTSAGPDPSVYSGGYGDGGDSSDYAAQMAALTSALSAYTAAQTSSTSTTAATSPTSSKSPAPPTSLQPGGPVKGKVVKPITIAKTPKTQIITVPKGATLLSLSQKYLGTSNRTQLAHMNGLGTGAGLRAGQKLKV